MHFAYPPRKTSDPPPFRPSTGRLAQLRQINLRALISIFVISLLGLYLLLIRSHRNAYFEQEPSGNPYVVIVTATDSETFDDGYLKLILENRQQYAAIHGQNTFYLVECPADLFRLRDFHCTDDRLPYRRRSQVVDQADGDATCPDKVPQLWLHLVSRPERTHHESENASRSIGLGEEASGGIDAARRSGCPREHHQDIRTS